MLFTGRGFNVVPVNSDNEGVASASIRFAQMWTHRHVNCAHTDLRGLCEDEFRVFDQTLQRHSDIDDLRFLLFLAGF